MRYLIVSLVFLLILFVGFFTYEGCSNPTSPGKSNQDTTSYNFKWEIDTLGVLSGTLQDIAIINENDIWVVGQLFLNDSTGQLDPTLYNAAHWDGQKWDIIRIYYIDKTGKYISIILSIFAFNKDDIWFGNFTHWDGKEFISIPLNISFPSNINKIWGTSDNDLYICGNDGNLAHWKDQSWTKIETGTNLQLLDIYGAPLIANNSSGVYQILAVGTSNYPPGRTILNINGNTSTSVSTSSLDILDELFTVWFVPFQHYYVAGDGIYEKNSLSDSTWENDPLEITRYAITKIRGNGLNDVFAIGAFGEVLHYNGKSWKSYINETGLTNGSYSALAVKSNLVVATGANNGKAVILIGRR